MGDQDSDSHMRLWIQLLRNQPSENQMFSQSGPASETHQEASPAPLNTQSFYPTGNALSQGLTPVQTGFGNDMALLWPNYMQPAILSQIQLHEMLAVLELSPMTSVGLYPMASVQAAEVNTEEQTPATTDGLSSFIAPGLPHLPDSGKTSQQKKSSPSSLNSIFDEYSAQIERKTKVAKRYKELKQQRTHRQTPRSSKTHAGKSSKTTETISLKEVTTSPIRESTGAAIVTPLPIDTMTEEQLKQEYSEGLNRKLGDFWFK